MKWRHEPSESPVGLNDAPSRLSATGTPVIEESRAPRPHDHVSRWRDQPVRCAGYQSRCRVQATSHGTTCRRCARLSRACRLRDTPIRGQLTASGPPRSRVSGFAARCGRAHTPWRGAVPLGAGHHPSGRARHCSRSRQHSPLRSRVDRAAVRGHRVAVSMHRGRHSAHRVPHSTHRAEHMPREASTIAPQRSRRRGYSSRSMT